MKRKIFNTEKILSWAVFVKAFGFGVAIAFSLAALAAPARSAEPDDTVTQPAISTYYCSDRNAFQLAVANGEREGVIDGTREIINKHCKPLQVKVDLATLNEDDRYTQTGWGHTANGHVYVTYRFDPNEPDVSTKWVALLALKAEVQ